MNLFLLTLKLNKEGYVCTWHSLRRLFKFVGIFKAFLKELKLTFKDIWLNLYTFFLFFLLKIQLSLIMFPYGKKKMREKCCFFLLKKLKINF